MKSDKDQSENSIFGNPISQEFAFQTLGENDNSSPAVIDMVNRLELAVKSNKIDAETINLYQQITSLITADRISQLSPFLNSSTINLIRDKSINLGDSNINSDKSIIDQKEQNIDNNFDKNTLIPNIDNQSDNQNIKQYPILSIQEIRTMQNEFFESRDDYQKNIENIEQNSLDQPNNEIKNRNI